MKRVTSMHFSLRRSFNKFQHLKVRIDLMILMLATHSKRCNIMIHPLFNLFGKIENIKKVSGILNTSNITIKNC